MNTTTTTSLLIALLTLGCAAQGDGPRLEDVDLPVLGPDGKGDGVGTVGALLGDAWGERTVFTIGDEFFGHGFYLPPLGESRDGVALGIDVVPTGVRVEASLLSVHDGETHVLAEQRYTTERFRLEPTSIPEEGQLALIVVADARYWEGIEEGTLEVALDCADPAYEGGCGEAPEATVIERDVPAAVADFMEQLAGESAVEPEVEWLELDGGAALTRHATQHLLLRRAAPTAIVFGESLLGEGDHLPAGAGTPEEVSDALPLDEPFFASVVSALEPMTDEAVEHHFLCFDVSRVCLHARSIR